MEIATFIILQFIAHIAADFLLQSNTMALSKNRLGFKSKWLPLHILIVFLLSWAASLQLKFIIAAAIIALLHYIIDGFKPRIALNKYIGNYAFFIDQLLHILVLSGVGFVYIYYFKDAITNAPAVNTMYVVLPFAYICCLKPSNILIKEVLVLSNIAVTMEEELPNGGRVIGNLERLLCLTFIIIGQWQAVGFLIAAKSILRYKDTDTLKTEYVLIGTMLSFGIAIAIGILIPLTF